jgi:hypothetical protein
MSQEFNGLISGGVAERDINNNGPSTTISIDTLHAGPDSIINFYIQSNGNEEQTKQGTRTDLLAALRFECAQAQCHQQVEEMSVVLFGHADYAQLRDENLRALVCLARNFLRYREKMLNSTDGVKTAMDESTFLKVTGMRASPPARAALSRLLKEDITTWSVARVWRGGELTFSCAEGLPRFVLAMPKLGVKTAYALFWGLVASGLFLMAMLIANRPQSAYVAVLWFGMYSAGFTVLLKVYFQPSFICNRLAPIVEKVNRELEESHG